MNSVIPRRIEELARPIVESKSCFIVDVSVRGERSSTVVELFIDADAPITAGVCSEISRELSGVLEDVVPSRYHLVVSSPGLDRPLKFPRQYAKHIGRQVEVKRAGSPDAIAGTLVGVTGTGIELEHAGGDRTEFIAFDDLRETKVRTPW
jgi:ribosome maturation factor RimP